MRRNYVRTPLLVGALVAVAMAGAIAYGMATGDFGEEFRAVLGIPWGRVTLIDLGAGLVVFGSWILYRERSWARSIPWLLGLVALGNLTTAVYLVKTALGSSSTEEFLIGRH